MDSSFMSRAKTLPQSILNSRKHRRFFLVLLVLSVFSFITLSFSRSSSVHRLGWSTSPETQYGIDDTSVPITKENNRYRGNTVAQEIEILEATWTCTDDDLSKDEKNSESNRRSRQCVVENLCVDRKGAFIRSRKIFPGNIPKINLLSADQESDVFWQPRVERSWRKVIPAHFVNETLFVHGLYSPFHFSHWLYNGMVPLYSTMKRFGATKNSWTLRNGRFAYDDVKLQGRWEMEHFFPTGKELVMSQYELATDFQTLPPADAPICFKRAVIGLGSQCALSYCEKNIPTEVYQSFREELSEYYWDKPETWSKHLTTSQDAIEKEAAKVQAQQTGEDRQQDLKKSDKSPLKCLDLARYYNFEEVSEGHSLEQGEKPNRVGQRYPDTADPEDNYQNEYQQPSTPGNNTQGESKRQLVVGIIQREKSRRVVNDQDLIMGLVQAGFRVKWMSFDHGCGLAETAYLLRDVNVLISPHGNAIGTSVFMPNDAVPTIISVDNSRYKERWFMYTATALGQRFISTVCGPSNYVDDATKEQCPLYKDLEGGAKVLQNSMLVLGLPLSMIKTDADKKHMSFEERQQMVQHNREYVASHADARALAHQELEEIIKADVSSALVGKYGEDIWSFYANFWKAIPRYVDVPRVVKFVQGLQADSDREKESGKAVGKYEHFINYVRKSQACGTEVCTDILERNVADDTSAFGQHSIDNVALWGQPTLESAKLRVGVKDVKDWQFDVQL